MTQALLMCLIAERRVAFPAGNVRSVIEIERITPIPRTAPHIAGLTALRSQALTVIDCRVALGFESRGDPVGSRAAVIDHEGHAYALVVDEAFDVVDAQGEPERVPGGYGEVWEEAAVGMVETASGPTLLIAIEKLVAGHRAQAA
ncbi:chemotaxis protein CheW [Erythrobacter sp. QSSC1-22B]|uniref:chemotaxis protein CheW n=1 Tax=Erythrobacter sp. QSSC1-22B TaxID=1860125 RepID=UPI000804EA83|nr:CheW domain-containing protein [Erythrobacter sp. QSSC1-22B]OBX18872.1 chemotaxis protein CheW [Erythrobacter sp. QSSC1-22B]